MLMSIKVKRVILCILLCVGVLFSNIRGYAEQENDISPDLHVRANILYYPISGQILYANNLHDRLPPASMTKVMTMLLTMEEVNSGRIGLRDIVTISQGAAAQGGAQIWLDVGEQLTVEDLLKAIAVPSANDAAFALAEYVAGSEPAFVRRMNEMVQSLGLENTRYVNPSGLPSENHYSSVYDMAIQAWELINRYPRVLTWTENWTVTLDSRGGAVYANRNRLVHPAEGYPGVDGLKTGHTQISGYCLVTTAERDGIRLISVVMGAENETDRWDATRELLNYGFGNFNSVGYEKGDYVGEIEVPRGLEEHVGVEAGSDIKALVERGKETEVIFDMQKGSDIAAPVERGDILGELVLIKDGEELVRGDLIATEDVERASVLTIISRWFRDRLSDIVQWFRSLAEGD